eukprot:12274355-Karenia_brevis.AAC.1
MLGFAKNYERVLDLARTLRPQALSRLQELGYLPYRLTPWNTVFLRHDAYYRMQRINVSELAKQI